MPCKKNPAGICTKMGTAGQDAGTRAGSLQPPQHGPGAEFGAEGMVAGHDLDLEQGFDRQVGGGPLGGIGDQHGQVAPFCAQRAAQVVLDGNEGGQVPSSGSD